MFAENLEEGMVFMLIIDNSLKETDFCTKTSEFIGSDKLRVFEIDFEYTMFAYYYDDGIHLALARNDDGPIDTLVWDQLKEVGILYPDINLNNHDKMWINDEGNTLHASVKQYSKF